MNEEARTDEGNPDEVQATPILPDLVDPFDFDAERNPHDACVAGYNTRESRKTIATSLRALARMASGDQVPPDRFAWHRLRHWHTHRLRRELSTRYLNSGANAKLTALRAVLRQCWLLELIDREAYERAAAVKNVPGWPTLAGRYIPPAELAALLEQLNRDDSAHGRRDRAIVRVLAETGIRATEASRLDRRDVDLRAGSITVRGKGHRRRDAFVLEETQAALAAWIEVRPWKQGPLFCRFTRHGRLTRKRLARRGIAVACDRAAEAAGVPHLTPHDLRRTFATDLLLAGEDVLVVSDLLGHATVDTTRRYDHRPGQARRSAVERLRASRAGQR